MVGVQILTRCFDKYVSRVIVQNVNGIKMN